MDLKLTVIALIFSLALSSCDSQTSAAKPLPQMLPGIRNFLDRHSEFGEPIGTQAIPDWAQGKRQRVQFSSGRNLLFYLNDGVVTTVFENSSTKIWGAYALPPKDPLKNQNRSSDRFSSLLHDHSEYEDGKRRSPGGYLNSRFFSGYA